MSLARSIGVNTAFTALGRYAVLLVWFAATPRLLDALGPDRFGFWSILLVLAGSLATLDLGLGIAVTRFTAELAGRGPRSALRSLVVRAWLVQVGVGIVLVGVGLLLQDVVLAAFHVPADWRPEAVVAYRLAYVGFLFGATANLLLAALQGLQRMDLAARVTLPLALALLVALWFAAGDARPLRALIGVQVAYSVLLACGLGLLVRFATRRVPGPAEEPIPAPSLRPLLHLGGWVQFNALLGLVQANVDKFILGAGIALAPVAAYEIGSRVTAAALLPPMIFLAALLPAFAHHESKRGIGDRALLYRIAIGPHFALSFALTGMLVALAPSLLEGWLGTPPQHAVLMLQAIAVTQLGNLVGGVASTAVRTGGRIEFETVYAILGTVLHVGLSLVGVRLWGAPGVLAGAVVGSIVAVLWFLARVESWLGMPALAATARAAWPAGVAALAAGLAAALSGWALAGLAEPGRARGIVVSTVGGGVYALVYGAVLALGFPLVWRELATRLGNALPSRGVS